MDKSGYLKAPKDCTFREDGRWLKLKVRGKELKYPRPDNLVTLGKDTFAEGENVCCAYNTSSPISGLNSLIDLMRAHGSPGLRYFEKDSIIVSDCYALEGGTIRYEETTKGDIKVYVGEREYMYNPMCMYYFPDGATVKKFDRICSGVVNMGSVISGLGNNLNDAYLIFRKQFYTLTKGFNKEGLTELDSTQEELIELLFTGLTRTTYDPKKNAVEEVEYLGTNRAISSKESFFTTLSFGYSSKVVNKALKGEVGLSGDLMSETVLGLLMNNKLDEK